MCSCDSDCMKFKQCCSDFKSHCDAHEPTPNEATEQDSTFSEGNNADDLIPLVSPTSFPQDDVSDDMYNQIFPNDEFSDNGVADPDASPIPESTSGYGSSTPDLLDQSSPEPTQDPDALELSTETPTVSSQTETTHTDSEMTQANDSPSTLYPTTVEAPTDASDPNSSSDSGTTFPQPTTAAEHDSSQPTPTTVPETEDSPATVIPQLDTDGQAEAQPDDDSPPEAQTLDPTAASSDVPEATTTASYTPVASESTGSTQDPSTVPASSTLDSSPIPEATTSSPAAEDTEVNAEDATTSPPLPDLEDPSEPDALTTSIPTSTDAAQDGASDDVTPGGTTADPLNIPSDPTKPTTPDATSMPQDKPKPYKPPPAKPAVAKPSSKPETKPLDPVQTLNTDDPRDYQADDSNDTNLCSGRPVSAVTTLRNGTIVVFRGHYFWFLDRNRVPGPARGITQVWGVPSPIDTVFTRCNCQGKTYIFKGTQYWRYENDVLDTGYPKVIETGFDGLRGHITAALSVPQYQRRTESVYFFKRGGSVQKYSYQFGTSPTCGRKPNYAIYTVRNRIVRQAVSALQPAINIRTSWRGFPSTITAAVSVPSSREPEGYKYYVFSRSKSYNVRMDGGRPAIATPPANTSPQSNNFFKCPKKV